MKKVVSVSLGSSKRDHRVKVELLGEQFEIARVGTDGDFNRAMDIIDNLDGQVSAIGLGGIDIYLYVGGKRYEINDGIKLMQCAKTTPVVDGSGLKNTLERQTIVYLRDKTDILTGGKKVLMVSALDRFGMAEALVEAQCQMIFGDLIFSAGIPYPIYSLSELEEISRKILPEMTKLPFHMLYPTGKKQDSSPQSQFRQYYEEAEIIAGDYHYIRKFMPDSLTGKTIITNTTTAEDVVTLRQRGLVWLVTTTPELNGRSFGTNVMEAVLVTIIAKPWAEIKPEEYEDLLQRLGFQPRIEKLN